jgi:dTDP-4-dehydrorhamnose 3,5-epimerase
VADQEYAGDDGREKVSVGRFEPTCPSRDKVERAIRKPNSPSIDGVRIETLHVRQDNRGWLVELLRADMPGAGKFGQLYQVNNLQWGIRRAFHMHLLQDEYFFVSRGTIQFVLVDERLESPTYGNLDVFVLDADRPQRLYVPRGVQHGSMSLVDGSQISAVTSEPYDPAHPDEVRLPADIYGDVWMVGGW